MDYAEGGRGRSVAASRAGIGGQEAEDALDDVVDVDRFVGFVGRRFDDQSLVLQLLAPGHLHLALLPLHIQQPFLSYNHKYYDLTLLN